MRLTRGSALLALPLATVLTVSACGGGSSGGTKNNGGGKPAQPTSNLPTLDINAKPVDQLKDGGTVRWSIDQFGPQWNILQVNGNEISMANVANAMLPVGTVTDEHANYSFDKDFWSASQTSTSPQKIEYKLNPKGKWSDGKPITAADFISEWKALNGTNKKFNVVSTTGYENISDVSQGSDQFDVIATFKTPFAEWPTLFNPLYPAAATATPKAFDNMYNNAFPISAGPFKFGGFDKSAQTATIVRDPSFWGAKPKLDSIVFKTLDQTAADQAFANGEIDYDYSMGNVASAYNLAKTAKNGHITVAGGPNQRQFTFHNSGVLADLQVRQAIAKGTNRLAIAQSDLTGLPIQKFATLDNHIFVPGQNGYQDNTGSLGKYDPKGAGTMLDADGWKLGSNGYRSKAGKELDVTFTIPAGTASSANEAKLFQPMMKAIGVKVVIKTVPSGDLFDKYIIPGNFEIAPFTWLGTAFPGSGAKSIYVTKGGQNFTGMSDPVIDQDFNDALSATDLNVYRQKLNDADAHVWTEVHSLMLFQRLDMDGVNNNLANIGSYGFATIDYTKIGFVK